jgi:hypothetical protein
MRGQTITYNDGWKQKLAVNLVKDLTILCQVLPTNWAADHNKISKKIKKKIQKVDFFFFLSSLEKWFESGGRRRRTATAGGWHWMVVAVNAWTLNWIENGA